MNKLFWNIFAYKNLTLKSGQCQSMNKRCYNALYDNLAIVFNNTVSMSTNARKIVNLRELNVFCYHSSFHRLPTSWKNHLKNVVYDFLLLFQEKLGEKEALLFCAGVYLNDEVVVSDLTCHTLDMSIPLLGGKVHGSLARAGKVKGQTPKVNLQKFLLFFLY